MCANRKSPRMPLCQSVSMVTASNALINFDTECVATGPDGTSILQCLWTAVRSSRLPKQTAAGPCQHRPADVSSQTSSDRKVYSGLMPHSLAEAITPAAVCENKGTLPIIYTFK